MRAGESIEIFYSPLVASDSKRKKEIIELPNVYLRVDLDCNIRFWAECEEYEPMFEPDIEDPIDFKYWFPQEDFGPDRVH